MRVLPHHDHKEIDFFTTTIGIHLKCFPVNNEKMCSFINVELHDPSNQFFFNLMRILCWINEATVGC